jgi:uncharacterized membrane protein YebE (DUF533 family)
MKHQIPIICTLLAALALQSGCMSSPISAASSSMSYPEWAMLGLGTAGGALIGEEAFNAKWAAPAGAAVGMIGTQAYLNYSDKHEAQLVAEAKEEARREERAKLMQDYWVEQSGSDSVDSYWKNGQRDVRYDAGVYDGVGYGMRELPRQVYFQEPPR